MKRKRNEGEAPDADVGTSQRKDSSPSFANFGLDPRLLQALAQEGFSTPTLVQAKAIPLALEGKDVLARAKTGSGKTIAYLLPVLHSILRRKADDPALRACISAIILVPTRELAQQVSQVVTALCECCTRAIRCVNLTQKVSDAVQRSQLAESPDILITTPGRLAQNLNRPELALEGLTHFVIDEADLVLSYGYEEDLQALAKAVPKGVQMMLLSATLSTDIDTLNGLFCRDPAILELDEKDDESDRMSQYVVKCAEEEKFLLTYVIFKLKLLKGKCIIFVSDVNRSYRLKLFLEQFGIRSCVLNSELPVNSRIHVVQEFNKNVYDIIIAADEHEAMGGKRVKPKRRSGNEIQDGSTEQVDSSAVALSSKKANSTEEQQDNVPHQGSEEEQEEDETAPAEPTSKKPKASKKAKEYGISRGIDFKNVACILNFDLPTSSKSYTHRIGRTARAGNSGTALSFVIPTELYNKHKSTTTPSAINDEAVLAQITKHQRKKRRDGKEAIQPYSFDMTQVEAFRYRMTDALRAVTRLAVHEARARELRRELLNSEKLKRYFEENPAELRHLQRHDAESHAVRVQPHLKHIPDYLMPVGAGVGAGAGLGAGAGAGAETASDPKAGNGAGPGTGPGIGTEIGFVPLRKPTDNRIRKARMMHRLKGKNNRGGGGRGQKPLTGGAGIVNNPLKSFKLGNSRRTGLR